MRTILLHDPTDHHRLGFEFNRGAAAILISTVDVLSKLVPDAEFVSLIQVSEAFGARYHVRVVENKRFTSKDFSLFESLKSWSLFLRCALWAALRRYLRVDVAPLIANRRLQEYRHADVILDISMDHYNDDRGVVKAVEISRDIMLAVLLRRPVVMYGQSPGPFRGRLASLLAKAVLKRVSLITVREQISQGWLTDMGLHGPYIQVTADPAFLLEPAPHTRISEILSGMGLEGSRLLVGIGTPEGELLGGTRTWSGHRKLLRAGYHLVEYCLPESVFMWLVRRLRGSRYYAGLESEHSSKTKAVIVQIVDHLVEKTGACVLLIPHYVPPVGGNSGEENGLVVAESIHSQVSRKDRVIAVTADYSPQEIKGIIGRCDLFVSMKMHPTIAATSQCVPTVAMGSHQKFRGIMQTLGQDAWVFDKVPEAGELTARIDEAWAHRLEIRQDLEARMPAIRESAMLNARLVKQLLDSSPERQGN